MILYLVRHGQDDESVRGGWCQHGLLEEGRQQSHLLGKQLEKIKFSKIYSSDLNRAKETAEIIQGYLKEKSEIVFSSDLREINNGLLAGMPNAIAEKKYSDLYYRLLKFDERYPGGESPKEFYERIDSFLKNEIKPIDNENVLLITLGGVISVMYHILNKKTYTNQSTDFSIQTGSYIRLSL